MFTRATATVTTMPTLKLGEFSKDKALVHENGARSCAGYAVPQKEKMVCELNADIYGKGFFGIKRKFDSNYI